MKYEIKEKNNWTDRDIFGDHLIRKQSISITWFVHKSILCAHGSGMKKCMIDLTVYGGRENQ